MEYRLYRPEDFAALYAIEQICFQPPQRFGRGYMRRLVEQAGSATWIAEDGERMAGFGIVEGGGKSTELTAYVQTLEVMPETRGLGVGAELLRRMEGSALGAGAQAIRLHVDAENASAIRLYERGGYQMHDSEEDYYGRGRPGLVYARQLTIQGNR